MWKAASSLSSEESLRVQAQWGALGAITTTASCTRQVLLQLCELQTVCH